MTCECTELVADSVKVSYGGHVVLGPVDLSLSEADITVVIGPSGSGKSTLLRVLAGIEKPSEGRVLLEGSDVLLLSAKDGGPVLLWQSPTLFPRLTCLENVQFPLLASGMGKSKSRKQAMELLAAFGLEHRARARPSQMSGGEQQRIAFARALAAKPRWLLLDEPFSHLDPSWIEELEFRILNLSLEGVGIVIVTHDIELGLRLGSQIGILINGELTEFGSASRLLTHPRSVKAAQLLGRFVVLSAEVKPINTTSLELVVGMEASVIPSSWISFPDEAHRQESVIRKGFLLLQRDRIVVSRDRAGDVTLQVRALRVAPNAEGLIPIALLDNIEEDRETDSVIWARVNGTLNGSEQLFLGCWFQDKAIFLEG